MSVCYGYLRVTPRQQERGEVPALRERIEAEHHRHFAGQGFTWGGLHCDVQVKLSKPTTERLVFRDLDRRLRKGDVVLMASLVSTFGNTTDLTSTLTGWHSRGVLFRVIDECPSGLLQGTSAPFENLTDEGRQVIELLPKVQRIIRSLSVNDDESDRRSVIGNRFRHGLERVATGGQEFLEPVANELELMAVFTAERDAGATFQEIYERHRDRGWTTYRGGRFTSSRTVRSMVEAYRKIVSEQGAEPTPE